MSVGTDLDTMANMKTNVSLLLTNVLMIKNGGIIDP